MPPTGGGGALLQRRFDVDAARSGLTVQRTASSAPPLPPGADLATRVEGVTPLITWNRHFYRVDTAISAPQIRPGDYRLRLTGMFTTAASFRLGDLYGRADLIERDITRACVSSEVGGGLAYRHPDRAAAFLGRAPGDRRGGLGADPWRRQGRGPGRRRRVAGGPNIRTDDRESTAT